MTWADLPPHHVESRADLRVDLVLQKPYTVESVAATPKQHTTIQKG